MSLPYDLRTPTYDRLAPLRRDGNNPAEGPDEESDEDSVNDVDWGNPQSFFESLSLPKPSSYPTAAEVKRESREHATKILGDWAYLHQILERHEATLQKRWLKKTREKRLSTLLSAWPNISKEHRPDFKAFMKETTERRKNGTRFKEAFMWPYINLEDLGTPKNFLLFLSTRGRHHPHLFAHADHDAAHFGYACGALLPAFLNHHVMMFTGRTTPETYGELIAWDDDENAFSWLNNCKGMHPGHGLQVLEIQKRIYGFLLDICLQLLHDISPERILSPEFPPLSEPPSVTKNDPDRHTLATVSAEAPYRPPASLDFSCLEAIIAGKRSAAEDHILALREDPGYFADVVGDWKEHRQELLLDTNGHKHPTLKRYPLSLFWNRVLGNVVSDAYASLEIWDNVYRQIVRLKDLKGKYSEQISPQEDLPKEYFEAFQNLRYFLEQFVKRPILNLKMGAPASPPLRSLFVREPQDPSTTKMIVTTRGTKRTESQVQLLWILTTLWDDQKLFVAGLKTLMDELERAVRSDAKQKELLSSWVIQMIADLALLSECTHQIHLYQPWASTFEDAFVDRKDEIQAEFAKATEGWHMLNKTFERTSLADLGAPEQGRFNYPVDKRRTRENVEAMRAAEGQLDAFWNAVDRHMPVPAGPTFDLLSSNRIPQRTAEWVEPAKPTKSKETPTVTAEVENPLSDLRVDLQHRAERIIEQDNLPTAKTKLKTRGTPRPPTSESEPAPEPLERRDIQPTFLVDKRALKVFSTLFFTASQSSQPGELAWADFLHAMRSTGFRAEQLYGSVWQFTPADLDVQRSIQFHEPHPSGKIPFRTARRHGRRLNRAYGWHGGMFSVV